MRATPLENETHLSTLTDGQLAQLSLTGEHEAFTVLVRRYQTPLLTYIRRLLKDDDLAGDTLQQVLLRLYNFLPHVRTHGTCKSWLFQVAHNCCVDEIRRRRRSALPFSYVQMDDQGDDEEMPPYDSADPRTSPEDIAEQRELQDLIQQAISSLPVKFRSVVLLRYHAQLTFKEISRIEGIPETTAKSHFHRGKKLLKSKLEEQWLLSAV